ncbi:ABC transporter permease subunit [Thiotrichales bacterium 19S11-10]|nr:ABC transporter permease subunit [Thiotrichales bacterium 19S11-10]MCF6807245.1 ABC transporter permease subunit [Thiotrichales bacterium 19S9-11]MCF6811214.1 ABC transporter permease subunit [Thiotrichales bacterium 19S9-12]
MSKLKISKQDILLLWQKRFVVLLPYLWFIIFLLIPFLIVLRISFSVPQDSIPPITPFLTINDYTINILINLSNYFFMLKHHVFFLAILNSLKMALITTICCILIGYPMTLAIVRAKSVTRKLILMLIIIPYWTSFLLRAYAWVTVLQNNGLVNQILNKLGFDSLPLIYNNFSAYLGLIYGYLPFFILPLYATLIKMDRTLEDAALDLGAKPLTIFYKIILPLSMPGLLAGSLLVFIPAVGEVIIPQILGGLNTIMVGNVIWQEFFTAQNWGIAAALAVILLLLLIIPIVLLQRLQQKQSSRRYKS